QAPIGLKHHILEEKLILTQNSLFIWKREQNNFNFSHKQRQIWPNKTGQMNSIKQQINCSGKEKRIAQEQLGLGHHRPHLLMHGHSDQHTHWHAAGVGVESLDHLARSKAPHDDN
ncbi:hypothetical protein ACJX0J_011300, partial [Zea mays]